MTHSSPVTDTELLPCPFCGSAARKDNGFSPLESVTYAYCSNNKCELHSVDVGFLPSTWNVRVGHAQQPSRDERLWALAKAIECVDSVPIFHQLIGEKKQKTLLDFKNDLKNAIRNQGSTEAPAAQQPTRKDFLDEVRKEIAEIAHYYTASFSGLPTGEDVAEWLTNDLWPNIAERLDKKFVDGHEK
jgi:hypothetical protein